MNDVRPNDVQTEIGNVNVVQPNDEQTHNYLTSHNDLSNESQVEPNEFIHHLKVFRNSNAKNCPDGQFEYKQFTS